MIPAAVSFGLIIPMLFELSVNQTFLSDPAPDATPSGLSAFHTNGKFGDIGGQQPARFQEVENKAPASPGSRPFFAPVPRWSNSTSPYVMSVHNVVCHGRSAKKFGAALIGVHSFVTRFRAFTTDEDARTQRSVFSLIGLAAC